MQQELYPKAIEKMFRKINKTTFFPGIILFVSMFVWDAAAKSGSKVNGVEESIELSLPINCKVGLNCWIVNYVDHDPTKNAKDFRCGGLTYDGHKGTDFAIRDIKEMDYGVSVLAAASGKIIAVRDGMPDISIKKRRAKTIKGRECGNGVRIKHKGGWTTQYCHLRNGSIQVFRGQEVFAGDNIGFVGLSGKTEFPHVHFVLRLEGQVVDPFVGLSKVWNCRESDQANWSLASRSRLKYDPPYIYSTGFSHVVPKAEAIRRGGQNAKILSTKSAAIVFWADIFSINVGDVVEAYIKDTDGQKLASSKKTIKKYQARYFLFIGKKRKKNFWPPGTYTGHITIHSSSKKTITPTKIVVEKLIVK
ncbi:MAG: hypothetical protein CFH06_00109 [Alphaproteobacteria bacterium MarineAlpha3_Bin5]|nr:peptidase M24 [Magnetovibrio sp.]PPR80106.1 MAG: hypothetical protein CFH06_00109 [Alphaproteobacteria bacterium MarineAlpha3_Bin5]